MREITKFFYIFIVFLLLSLSFLGPKPVFANPICDGTSPACIDQYIPYTREVCSTQIVGGYPQLVCTEITTYETRCTIPQSGGGQCSCCYEDGCYLNCPGTNTGGGSYSYSQGSYAGGTPTPTPTPLPGTIRVRAVTVSSTASACSAFTGNTNYVTSSVTVNPPGQTQSLATDGSYTAWTNQPVVGSYTTYSFSDAAAAGQTLQLACWSRNAPAAASSGYSADLYPGSTITWDLGYSLGATWFQTIGGDVYASTGISSGIPVGASPRYFDRTPTQGTAGVVTYGASYDFDSSATEEGESYISSPGWLANETYRATDFYAVMYHRFGSPAATHTGDTVFSSKPASGTYVVDGNLTIDTAAWNVGAAEDIIVLVDGNLTITEDINLTDPGFVAFIVNGDIIVDPSVGVLYTSSTPALEGVYITSPTGTFHTGDSSVVGAQRFVGEGIFIAGDFELERDLDALGVNNTTSSELFIYNPALLISMPDEMRDVPVTWQEVAP
jgi:hypothetical protein